MPYKRMDCLFDFHANVAWFGICGKQRSAPSGDRSARARLATVRFLSHAGARATRDVDATASTVGGDEGAVQERVPSGAVACKNLALRDERIECVLDHLPIPAVALDDIGREIGWDVEHHHLENRAVSFRGRRGRECGLDGELVRDPVLIECLDLQLLLGDLGLSLGDDFLRVLELAFGLVVDSVTNPEQFIDVRAPSSPRDRRKDDCEGGEKALRIDVLDPDGDERRDHGDDADDDGHGWYMVPIVLRHVRLLFEAVSERRSWNRNMRPHSSLFATDLHAERLSMRRTRCRPVFHFESSNLPITNVKI